MTALRPHSAPVAKTVLQTWSVGSKSVPSAVTESAGEEGVLRQALLPLSFPQAPPPPPGL